jgi:hypothetical protein
MVPRVSVSTPDDVMRHASAGKPVVFTKLAAAWPAMSWSPDVLAEKYGAP